MVDSYLSPVVLHIGFEKTGTKSIQYWLRDHEQLLTKHRMRFPRGWLRLNCHQELPLALLRPDRLCSPRERGDEWRDVQWRTDVIEQIADDLRSHRDWLTILSSENLDLMRYDDEFAALRTLVGDAEVIVYLRERGEWLDALRDQYLHKNAPGRTLSSDPEAYNFLEPHTWRIDYATLLDGWRQWFSRVRVSNYDYATLENGSVLPSFLRRLGLPEIDADYRLNTRDQPTPRAEGNRLANGLLFGQQPAVLPTGRYV